MANAVYCSKRRRTIILLCPTHNLLLDPPGNINKTRFVIRYSLLQSLKVIDIRNTFNPEFQVTLYSMFVAVMAFFARVSDPAVGGTYMTLLNTLCNLGGNWPATTALWLVDALSFRQCTTDPTNDCSTALEREVRYTDPGSYSAV